VARYSAASECHGDGALTSIAWVTFLALCLPSKPLIAFERGQSMHHERRCLLLFVHISVTSHLIRLVSSSFLARPSTRHLRGKAICIWSICIQQPHLRNFFLLSAIFFLAVASLRFFCSRLWLSISHSCTHWEKRGTMVRTQWTGTVRVDDMGSQQLGHDFFCSRGLMLVWTRPAQALSR